VAVGSIYLRVTVIAMSLLASEIETGYYATAFRVMEVIVAIPPIVVGATLPVLARAARDDAARLQYVLQRLLDAMLIVGLLLALAVLLGAPFIIHVLAGNASDPSIPVLRIQAIAIVAAFVATSWQHGLISMHRHAAILTYSVVALVTGVTLTVLLVPPLGAQGAAIAFSGGETVVTILAYVLLRRANPELHFSPRIPLRVIAAAAFGTLVLLIPGLPSVADAALGCAVFAAALLAFRAVPAELLEALGRRRAAPS
jgi:O-antigen/teichoic acid export membrane protein